MFFIDNYGGALVEEFIEGNEHTVLVFENLEDRNSSIVLEHIYFNLIKSVLSNSMI